MFLNYLNEKKSWILFYLLALGLADAVIWLDRGIGVEFTAILYMNVLLFLFFVLFLIWRFYVEMKYAKELIALLENHVDVWHKALPAPSFFRDQIFDHTLHKVVDTFSRDLSEVNNRNVIESEYTAAWVHEVKAPLTAMKLAIDANRHDPVVRKIEMEWLRVHLLLDQQLSISRLPSLESDYIVETASIQRLATNEIRELASWCMEKNLAVEFGGEDVEVVTDPKWCQFVIRQLLTNTVKYSPVGGTIMITVGMNDAGNAMLTMTDEGPGIQPHDLPRIFDKGFTGDTGRIHNVATGLGLYLAQTVATKIGLTLTVSSEIGKGTTMQMTFSKENEFDQTLK